MSKDSFGYSLRPGVKSLALVLLGAGIATAGGQALGTLINPSANGQPTTIDAFWNNGFWNDGDSDAPAPKGQDSQPQNNGQNNSGQNNLAIAPSVSGPNVIAEIVQRVGPAVVRIDSSRTVQASGPPMLQDPFFRQFFGNNQPAPQGDQVERGVGSGFITSTDGEIITNAHVVAGADEVQVTLKDGRSFTGRVMGADSVTDVAVIKVEAPGHGDDTSIGAERPHLQEWIDRGW